MSHDIYKKVKAEKIFNVGAAMDFLTKKKKEAPDLIQKFGLEWLYRLVTDFKYSKNNTSIEIHALNHYFGKFNPKQMEGILFQIVDKGIGIKQEDIPHLFERFFRCNDVADIPGTGLGLTIAKELISLHGGTVSIDSEFGKGTTVSVFFPYQMD